MILLLTIVNLLASFFGFDFVKSFVMKY